MTSARQIQSLLDLVSSVRATQSLVAIPRVVDQILEFAAEFGSLKCSLANEQTLIFRTNDQLLSAVDRHDAKVVLRTICARFAVVGRQGSGHDVSPYGGDFNIELEAPPDRRNLLSIRFKNTPECQGFEIEARPSTSATTAINLIAASARDSSRSDA